MSNVIFRKEALTAKASKNDFYGEIILASSINHTLISVFAIIFIFITIAFLFGGHYTKRVTVHGELISESGITQIYAVQSGLIKTRSVSEGQEVKAGDILFILSSDRKSQKKLALQESINIALQDKRNSLASAIKTTEHIHSLEMEALHNNASTLTRERDNLDEQISLAVRKMALSEGSVKRYKGLMEQGYIAPEQLDLKQEELLEQKIRLKDLERNRADVDYKYATVVRNISSMPLTQLNIREELARSLQVIDQEVVENEAKYEAVVSAPSDGIITAIRGNVGQTAKVDEALAAIVPSGSKFQARLYVPSRAIGFIRKGAVVGIRYQSFPYQKFGQAKGAVLDISEAPLLPEEIPSIANSDSTKEPMYRVTIELDRQYIKAYGDAVPLRAGMLLEADIMIDKRKLYEWIVEPIYSITGKI